MRRYLTGAWLSALLLAGPLAVHAEGRLPARPSKALRVRASPAFAACLGAPLEAFSRQARLPVVLDVAEPDPPGEADVVVGDDSELIRVLEGGAADLDTSFDLGYIPWVFVVPSGSPADLSASLAGADAIVLLGGRVGREARISLGQRLPSGVRATTSPIELGRARFALVPRSLAGPGDQRPAGLRPLVAVAAAVRDAGNPAGARRLLDFLASDRGHGLLASCLSPSADATEAAASDTGPYAVSVVDWWLPQCTIERNGYNDPGQVVGPPDAVSLGARDQYAGFMSLGQGGYVTVDMGASAVDGAGADVRVFQSVAGEPVTLYAAAGAQGPFVLLGLRTPCGLRTPGVFSHHCDFDLHEGGLAEARFFKIEDGEIYPCLKGGTITEGSDIDGIQILNPKP
ncbi:MAG TPA: hypothetical protein VLF95_14075, partial [Vicinamibacteria bacterium]|nr:hypothetical protein [Vicinamibacteria bacterium]